MHLRRNLMSCSMSKYPTLTEYARDLERCRAQLTAIGETVDDDDMFMLLGGLSTIEY
jgi:hypothetical protein